MTLKDIGWLEMSCAGLSNKTEQLLSQVGFSYSRWSHNISNALKVYLLQAGGANHGKEGKGGCQRHSWRLGQKDTGQLEERSFYTVRDVELLHRLGQQNVRAARADDSVTHCSTYGAVGKTVKSWC